MTSNNIVFSVESKRKKVFKKTKKKIDILHIFLWSSQTSNNQKQMKLFWFHTI